jgi:sporulation protein YlmC with PRC-barrel domain
MTPDTDNDVLVKLTDVNLTVSDPNQDIRNRKVIDQDKESIGYVSGLFIDQDERKVRMLQVAAGGFLGLGERHFLIPVEAISSITPDAVRINQTRERIVNSPAYDPKLDQIRSRAFWEPYYGYYGYAPYWGGGGLGYPLL